MEPFRHKRRAIQAQRHIKKANLRNSPPVTEVLSARARSPVIQVPQPAIRPQLNLDLPGGDSRARVYTFFRKAPHHRLRRWAFRTVTAGLVLVITLGGLLFSQAYLKAHKVFKGGTGTAAALKANVDPSLLKGEGRGRVNILLLGRGGGTHDAPDLTDTLMLASVDPVNHTATLLSLPRDFWVRVDGAGTMKLNAVWQTGASQYLGTVSPGITDTEAIKSGFKTLDQTVGETLGLQIDYNVLVDFQAFQQAVDTVGGVNVTVPSDLIDPTMAWENSHNPVLARAGNQTFDGQQALRYVRSRETSSDFARGERQRAVMMALKTKVINLGTLGNPLKVSGLLNAFGDNVQTDLSIDNATRLYSILKDINDDQVTSLGLGDGTNQYVTTGNINGQSVVLPTAGLFQYDKIQQFIRSQLKDPYIMKEKAKILVLNASMVPGAATQKAEELKSYGYTVSGTGNTPAGKETQTTLVDLSHGKAKYTKNYLEQRLGTKATTHLDDTTISTNGAEFVIILR